MTKSIPTFAESELVIPLPERLPALVWREGSNPDGGKADKEIIERFTESDYKDLQEKIKGLQKKNDDIQAKIANRDSYITMMDEQETKYKTFYQMFENGQERNDSYYKMFLSMISMVLFLVIIVAIYYNR
jgi:hypothetical protein